MSGFAAEDIDNNYNTADPDSQNGSVYYSDKKNLVFQTTFSLHNGITLIQKNHNIIPIIFSTFSHFLHKIYTFSFFICKNDILLFQERTKRPVIE